MTKTFTVNVALSVIGINNITGEYNILSLEPENLVLPYQILDNNSISQILTALSEQHIDLDTNWIQFKLLDVIIKDEIIMLLYRCYIPLDTKISNIYWIPSWKCLNNPLISIILGGLE
jgi:hypothetical protein